MPPRICAIVVTYNPDSPLADLFAALAAQVERIYVVDNSTRPAIHRTLEQLAAQHRSLYLIINAENAGLARAQNQGIRQAMKDGFSWVLLMDDDSLPEAHMVERMLATHAAQRDPRIGILAPRIVERNVATPARYLVRAGRLGFRRHLLLPGQQITEAMEVIASGSLIRTNLFTEIGLMAENFFIDGVDHEFCLRARARGYRILVCGDAVLQHSQGNKRLHFGIIVTQNHSPLRRYYIFRNRIFVLRLYGTHFPFLLLHEPLACGWDMLRIVFLETDKAAKLKSAIRGVKDGLAQPVPVPPAV